jgi:hypothetical protein
MLMPLWRKANGSIIVDASGHPILCDSCPCAESDPALYFAGGNSSAGGIARCDALDTTPGETILTTPEGGAIRDITIAGSTIYFTQEGTSPTNKEKVRSCTLEGDDLTTLIETDTGGYRSITHDSGKLYYVRSGFFPGVIASNDFDGGDEQTLVTLEGDDSSRSVEYIHHDNGYIYFTSEENFGAQYSIRRVNVDGSGLTTLVTKASSEWILEGGIYVHDGKIYVLDTTGDGRIVSFDVDGSNEADVYVGDSSEPVDGLALAVWPSQERLYFIGLGSVAAACVSHVDLDGTDYDGAVTVGTDIFGIHAYDP